MLKLYSIRVHCEVSQGGGCTIRLRDFCHGTPRETRMPVSAMATIPPYQAMQSVNGPISSLPTEEIGR